MGHNSTTESIAADRFPLDDCIKNMTMAEFCYPYKTALLYFIDAIYFDIEKEVSDENVLKIKAIVDIIRSDMDAVVGIMQRVSAQKGGSMSTRKTLPIADTNAN